MSAYAVWIVKVVASTPEKRVYSKTHDETYEGVEGVFHATICVPTSAFEDSGEAEDFVMETFEDHFTPLDDDNGEPAFTHISAAYEDIATEFVPED